MSNTNNTQQAFWVGIGSLFSFGFALVSSMILSRFFDKADYGTYKQVIYVYSTLLTVFTLGIPKAFSYFLPRVPISEAKSLITKLTNLFYFLGAIFSIILFIFSEHIGLFLKNPDLELALRIFSPVPLLMLPTMGLESILATYRKTQFIAIYTISTRIFVLLCVTLPVLLFDGTYIQAIIGFVASSVFTFLLAVYLKNYPIRHEAKDKTNITYKEIFRYSMPLFHASIWGIIIHSADQFFISRFFGNEVFAEFSNGSLELPFVGMVVGAGATVLGPIFSKQLHFKADVKTEILPLWTSVFEKTVKIIYPLVLFSLFFADMVMVILYGNIYQNSGNYFRIKLAVNLFTIISYTPLILAIGATRYYANVHMVSVIILIVLEYLSILVFKSPYVVTIVSVACQIGRIVAMLLYISIFFKINLIQLIPIKLIAKIVLPSVLLLFVIQYITNELFHFSPIFSLGTAMIFYGLTYFLWCYFAKIDYLSIIKPLYLKLNG